MRIERKETFLGLENEFPVEQRTAVQELMRRIEGEFDGMLEYLQNPWTVSGDTEAVLFDLDGSRLFEQLQDGTKILLTEDFGQDDPTL